MNTFQLIRSDFRRFRNPLTFGDFIRLILTNPGLRASILIRIIHGLYSRRMHLLAGVLRVRLLRVYGADVVPGVQIGPGLKIEHPVGLVLGKGVILGENCSITSHVTIGSRYGGAKYDGAYPRIGMNSYLGAGSIIIGGITLGDDVQVGAGAIVIANVPDFTSVVGVHSK